MDPTSDKGVTEGFVVFRHGSDGGLCCLVLFSRNRHYELEIGKLRETLKWDIA